MSYRSLPVLLATVLLILAGCDSVQETSDVEGVWYASAEFHERYLVITDEHFAWYVKQSASPCYLEAEHEIDRVEGDVYTLVMFRIRQPGQEVPYEELLTVKEKYRAEREGRRLVVTDLSYGRVERYEKSEKRAGEIEPVCELSR